ncbi:PHP domain-containing protein [Acetobacterium fimetarium]|uniref:PHP domain-containing protein n=1 Tax=Acetobacterium fimetarium TaxID=52691 RepID=A0ABR6WXQ4_9FIRM|nr:PHP domain-containing protein [Acetobacterium fimetarium]MBC3805356.1 PHP domain-containing protein [Acetobacterium fimetarium]
MDKVAIDLHIHSVLSPCGEEEMTPNNIVNMALLKEIDYIAVTDHNTAKNLPAVLAVAKEIGEGICILPGIEVTTKEEAHILAYFPTLEGALELDEMLYQHLPEVMNRKEMFGPQYIMDENDDIIGEVDKLLISATDIGVDQLWETVTSIGGVIVPAHIDRKSFSIIASLGFIPPELAVKTCEISKGESVENVLKKYQFFRTYQFIHGSDAHQLEDMAEREYFIELEDMQRQTLIRYLG